jgi:hypothetical protein
MDKKREHYILQIILYFSCLIKKVKTYTHTHMDILYTEEMKKKRGKYLELCI